MWQSYLNGLLVTAGLIMAIGAQNAFVLAQGLKREHHIPAALLCVLCDALLIGSGVFGLAQLLARDDLLMSIARWAGVVFLIGYGALALRRAIFPQPLTVESAAPARSRRSVLLATLAVTLLNPHVYLDTVLLIGSLGAQQPVPAAYVLGASSASLLWFASLALGAAWLAPWLARPLTWRLVDLAVAAMMFVVAVQLLNF